MTARAGAALTSLTAGADPVGVSAVPWLELVEHARLAPSPHNTQPWLVRVSSATEAELRAPAARLLPVEDPEGRFLTAAMGMFVEALDVAAAAHGLELEAEPAFPPLGRDATGDAHVARLALRPTGHATDRLALLDRRRTSRLPYDGRPAPQEAIAELEAVASGFGHRAQFTRDPGTVESVVRLNADTLFDDLHGRDRREEIAQWTRLSESEASRRADGFSPRCLGFPAPLVRLFLRHHRVCEPALMRRLLTAVYLRSMRGTATVGWITGPWSRPNDCFDAGRMLMRFWLALTARGLYLQPFGSVITNCRSRARLEERLEIDRSDGEPWLLLRIGYSSVPPRSARRPAAEIVA